MKREIAYESETILPIEITRLIDDTQEYVLADRNDPDKMEVHFSWLRRCITGWFLNHRHNYKEEK
jgi:hypothetical protein